MIAHVPVLTVETLQFLTDLIHRHRVNPTPETKAKLGDRDIFFKGQATMQLIGASNVNLYQQNDQFKWDWRPVPAGKAGAKNWGGGNTFGLTGLAGKFCETLKLAMRFSMVKILKDS